MASRPFLVHLDAGTDPTAMIGASNRFEVAITTATMLYGVSSGAALATVVGVLIEVLLMLMLVKFLLRTQEWFPHRANGERVEEGTAGTVSRGHSNAQAC